MIFQELDEHEALPYDLLLLADPSKEIVDSYLKTSSIFIVKHQENLLGVIVLLPLTAQSIEIKNIAVAPTFQGRGIGSYLINEAINVAKQRNYHHLYIGTANSSIAQLYLYQKLGFQINDIKMDFFTKNYLEPIYENGIQAKHMIVLTKELY